MRDVSGGRAAIELGLVIQEPSQLEGALVLDWNDLDHFPDEILIVGNLWQLEWSVLVVLDSAEALCDLLR